MSGINNVLMYNGVFSQETTSEAVFMTEGSHGITVFVSPLGTDASTVLQVRDPTGGWHTFTAAVVTADGATDGLVMPANAGAVRAVSTPGGSGTLIVWSVAQGG